MKASQSSSTNAAPYYNPYAMGMALGVVLYLSYVFTSHGLGASGGLARWVTVALRSVAPNQVDAHAFFARMGAGLHRPLSHWLIWEIFGVLIGGFVAGWLGRRVRLEVQRGWRISAAWRLVFATAGGLLVGWGTQLSRGCTSGQALSGGAVMSVGSWAFMFAVFGGAYAVAYPLRKLWR
jgi:uncharacterized membrane protein YedE/YeeE